MTTPIDHLRLTVHAYTGVPDSKIMTTAGPYAALTMGDLRAILTRLNVDEITGNWCWEHACESPVCQASHTPPPE